jgi:hypothetical protein
VGAGELQDPLHLIFSLHPFSASECFSAMYSSYAFSYLHPTFNLSSYLNGIGLCPGPPPYARTEGVQGPLPGCGVSPTTPFLSFCRRRRQEKGVQGHPAGVWGVPKSLFSTFLPLDAKKRGAGSPCRGVGCPQVPLFYLSAAAGGKKKGLKANV